MVFKIWKLKRNTFLLIENSNKMLIFACINILVLKNGMSSLIMSLKSIKIPGDINIVEGTKKQYCDIFLFTISTCMWCKKGKRWLKNHGYSYSYLDIDKIPVKKKNQLKNDIEKVFGVRPRFPFLIVNEMQYDSGFNPDTWEEIIQ